MKTSINIISEYHEDSLPKYLDYFSSKLNLHGGLLRSMVILVCLRQITGTCVIHGMSWLGTPSFIPGLNAWIVLFGVVSMRSIWKP